MPPLPTGEVCIRRFARVFDGVTEGSGAVRYQCRAVATERMATSITFRITAKMDCDDVGTLVPVTGLVGALAPARRSWVSEPSLDRNDRAPPVAAAPDADRGRQPRSSGRQNC